MRSNRRCTLYRAATANRSRRGWQPMCSRATGVAPSLIQGPSRCALDPAEEHGCSPPAWVARCPACDAAPTACMRRGSSGARDLSTSVAVPVSVLGDVAAGGAHGLISVVDDSDAGWLIAHLGPP